MSYSSDKINKLTKLALFSAVIIILSATPLGYIPLGAIRATTVHIPVIIGGILLGPMSGAFLGFVFGLTSFVNNTINPTVTSFVFTPFYSLGQFSGGFFSVLICFVPRILIGLVSSYSFKFLGSVNKYMSIITSSFLASITNTVLVMLGIYCFFGDAYAQARDMPYEQLSALIIGVISVNGFLEAIVASVITVFVVVSLLKITHLDG